jgi:hypothetical protein
VNSLIGRKKLRSWGKKRSFFPTTVGGKQKERNAATYLATHDENKFADSLAAAVDERAVCGVAHEYYITQTSAKAAAGFVVSLSSYALLRAPLQSNQIRSKLFIARPPLILGPDALRAKFETRQVREKVRALSKLGHRK